MKLKSKLLASAAAVATPVIAVPISTSAVTVNSNTPIQNSKTTNLVQTNQSAKLSLAGTWTHDEPHKNYFDGGIEFKNLNKFEDQTYKFYKPVTLDGNKLTFDSVGHDVNYHIITQKVRMDFVVPAKSTKYINIKIKMSTTSHAHADMDGWHVRHTQELFNLGEDGNANPEFFNDEFHPRAQNDKYSLWINKICHEDTTQCPYTKFHDSFEKQLVLRFKNNTDKPITKTNYIMASITSNGSEGKYGDIGSETYTTFDINEQVSAIRNYDISLAGAWTPGMDYLHARLDHIRPIELSPWNENPREHSPWKDDVKKEYYKEPILDEFNKKLTFDTKGHACAYQFIAQKVKIDFNIPAHSTKDYEVAMNMDIVSHGHAGLLGHRVEMTTEMFNFGEDGNSLPERFIFELPDDPDRQWSRDKHSIGTKYIHHTGNRFRTYNDNFVKKCKYHFENTSNEDITKSIYLIVSVTTSGGTDNPVGSETYTTFDIRESNPTDPVIELDGAWTHNEPHKNYFDGGIEFKNLVKFAEQKNNFYKPVKIRDTFDKWGKEVVFDTKGHDVNYHIIAQRLKLTFKIPAHTTKTYQVNINMNTTTHAHSDCQGYRVWHTQEMFDLGNSDQALPTFFNDAFHENPVNDKHSLGINGIKHSKNVIGANTYHDGYEKAVWLTFENTTDEEITNTRYLMISITTNGDKGKFGDIGSETYTRFNIKEIDN